MKAFNFLLLTSALTALANNACLLDRIDQILQIFPERVGVILQTRWKSSRLRASIAAGGRIFTITDHAPLDDGMAIRSSLVCCPM
ncbi:hypothetical protein [Pseudomonas prosekii]|uniref:hypothetical protein n=1 Tax=Pseudomonas prosekii TaxID=1148509 RepID=UPI003F754678